MTKEQLQYNRILEIRLCPSVICGQNDAIIAIPLGKCQQIDKHSLHFQGLYLSVDHSTIVGPEELNSKTTKHLDSFIDGLLYITVIRYFFEHEEQFVLVKICANVDQMRRKVSKLLTCKTPLIAFQYSWVCND